MPAKWLKDTVFYEIYPQSFRDTNGDGIGDFNGIIEKLDYIKSLGCNALWINPCFDSPFKDAGYDVRDYKKTASRYGTNEDLYRLFSVAHEKGIRVLLDLVPGHTSEEHAWFKESQKAQPNDLSGRYIWTDSWIAGCRNIPYIGGETERDATYLINFFKCQPALNYGFFKPEEPWQMPMDHPEALKTREAIKDVMRFWLSHGCDGFRVDMAASLVKYDDEKKSGTSAVWRDIRQMLDAEFPDAALIAEWGDPKLALRCGFDMDFYLSNWGNGYEYLMREYNRHWKEKGAKDNSYFRADSAHDIAPFMDQYLDWYRDTKDLGYISLITCNHDTTRPRFNMDPRELKLCYAFLFTLPGVPFLYYGDEIGMRYQQLPTKEGGYTRTGSRTPMQWAKGKNLGFSGADESALYLPVDPSLDAPTVADQEKDPDSLLHTVRAILRLKHQEKDLQADGSFAPLFQEAGKPFAYRRGELILAVNPARESMTVPVDAEGKEFLFTIGTAEAAQSGLLLGPQSFAVLK